MEDCYVPWDGGRKGKKEKQESNKRVSPGTRNAQSLQPPERQISRRAQKEETIAGIPAKGLGPYAIVRKGVREENNSKKCHQAHLNGLKSVFDLIMAESKSHCDQSRI